MATKTPGNVGLLNSVRGKLHERFEAEVAKSSITNGEKVLPVSPEDGEPRAVTADLDSPICREKLLSLLRDHPVVLRACRETGITYRHLLAHCRADPDFERDVDDAKAEGWARVEEAAFSEATAGGHKTHKLIEFLLKGRRRDIYGDRLDVRAETRHEVVINLLPPATEIRNGAVVGDGRHADIPDALPENGHVIDVTPEDDGG